MSQDYDPREDEEEEGAPHKKSCNCMECRAQYDAYINEKISIAREK